MRWRVALLLVAGLAPSAGADSRTARARALYESGMAHYTLDEYDQAIEAFQAAFRERPDPVFLYNIAQAARLAKKTEMALHYYEKYLHASEHATNRAEVEERIQSLEKVLAEQTAATNAKPATPLPPTAEPPVAPPVTPPVGHEAPAAPNDQPPARVPVYKRWWLWTIVALAVVGGTAVALGLTLGTGSGASAPPADYGPLPIGFFGR